MGARDERWMICVRGGQRQSLGCRAPETPILVDPLNNWRRHGEDQASPVTRTAPLDRYSTAFHFDGWVNNAAIPRPPADVLLPSAAPQTWLLRIGWRVHGAIGTVAVPGPADPGRAR